MRRVEWLVEGGLQARGSTQPHRSGQLSAAAVDPRLQVVGADRECRILVRTDIKSEIELHDVRAPGFLQQMHVQGRLTRVPGQRVGHALEVGERKHGVHALGQLARVDHVSGLQAERLRDEFRIRPLESDEVHSRQRDLVPPGPGRRFPPGQVLVLGHRIPHEVSAMCQCRGAPLRDRVFDPVERRRADVPHLDHDLDVGGAQRIELLSLIGADQHVERARHHRQRRAQVVSRGRGIRHRDRDDHVGTGLRVQCPPGRCA